MPPGPAYTSYMPVPKQRLVVHSPRLPMPHSPNLVVKYSSIREVSPIERAYQQKIEIE